ncbi:NAD(P)/FAD-dependent oxidoreductase [Planctomycetaceae bacterium SH139]
MVHHFDSHSYDVAVIGAGFSGSLLANILAAAGRRVALIDPVSHPRFAIGESSTPIADLLLESISDRYQLHRLRPLARYGSWKRTMPEMDCGQKRGFSYFVHHPGESFLDDRQHSRSLLVAASRDREVADTHWLRADVDHFLFTQAVAAGVEAYPLETTGITRNGNQLELQLAAAETSHSQQLTARFVVVATGANPQLAKLLGIAEATGRLQSCSYTTFAHLQGLASWDGWLSAHNRSTVRHHLAEESPFPSDLAAQHHLLENGWLWMLRFDSGRTSVGWTRPWRPAAERALAGERSLIEQFGISDYPDLVQLFSAARVIAPRGGPVTTQRLQRLTSRVVGDDFALLPTAAATIDPLHSGGIAHALSGVWRMADILLTSRDQQTRRRRLAEYERAVMREAMLMDQFVAGCYAARNCLPLFTAHAMFYFAAAIATEEAFAAGAELSYLWLANHQQFTTLVAESTQRIQRLMQLEQRTPEQLANHMAWTRTCLAPWNQVGLLADDCRNMYHYTTAPK